MNVFGNDGDSLASGVVSCTNCSEATYPITSIELTSLVDGPRAGWGYIEKPSRIKNLQQAMGETIAWSMSVAYVGGWDGKCV